MEIFGLHTFDAGTILLYIALVLWLVITIK
jgi:hypothetical protein